ncbi:hypothetical protein D3C72_1091980 [compost metagenome]
MRRLFQTRRDEDLPAPCGQLVQRTEQRLDFLLPTDHPRRVQRFVADLQQLLDFLAGEQTRIGLTAVGGDVQGHAIEVGIGPQDVRRSLHAVDPQVGFVQHVVGQIFRTETPAQAHPKVLVGGQEQLDHRTLSGVFHPPETPSHLVHSMRFPDDSGNNSNVTG